MSNPYDSLPARTGFGLVNVIVDTPRGSRNKFKFDAQAGCFRLSRILPLGAAFPYDFGSIPRTIAEDGDPLDVMVICDEASFCGCLLNAKIIGAVRAEQTEKGRTIRNDRLLAVPVTGVNPAERSHIDELPSSMVAEIEHFFVSHNRAHGRQFRPTGHAGPDEADRVLAAAEQRYQNPPE
ncbi:MAG TPA: inorganic diphosphatase [Burkholderiales bacterium]|nr:inorganic diphosphatase [Burkholderiales bacterium]